MKRFMKILLRYLVIFSAGMMTYGVIQCAILSATGRVNTTGSEMFVLPLMALLVYIGWGLSKAKWENIDREKAIRYGYDNGYRIATEHAAGHVTDKEGK